MILIYALLIILALWGIVERLMNVELNAQIQRDAKAASDALDAKDAEIAGLKGNVSELQTALANSITVTPETSAALAALETKLGIRSEMTTGIQRDATPAIEPVNLG